jgi:hypothetical protein
MGMRALLKKGIYYYFFPSFSQARRVIWDGLTESGDSFINTAFPPEAVARRRNDEMKLELINGSIIQLIGTDNYDSIRGANPTGCVFSEYAMQDPRCWESVISPIVRKNGGWAVFNSTPLGKNHFYDLWNMALKHPETWYTKKLTVEDTGLITPEQIDQERSEGRSEEIIQQEYYCFPPEAPVLTSTGLKDIGDVRVGELVLTHTNRYRRVDDVISRVYDGPLIEIQSYGNYQPIRCTPEHPIRVCDPSTQTYEWKRAGDIQPKDFLVFPKNQILDPLISSEMAYLIAAYVCDGSLSKNAVQLTIGMKELIHIEKIKSCLNALEFSYSENLIPENKCLNIVINNTRLTDFFLEHCGITAKNKHLPMTMIAGNESTVYESLINGDGFTGRYNGHQLTSFTTISKTLAYQVQIIASSLGFHSGISRKDAGVAIIFGRECQTQPAYQVNIREESGQNSMCRHSKYAFLGAVKSVSQAHHRGYVYNLRVHWDESYTAYGRVVHNCSFERGVEGSYYGKVINSIRQDSRICRVPYDPHLAVHTFWDLGYGDSTAIIFAQLARNEIHIIDYYENHNEGLAHYAKVLQDKNYRYGDHWAPHDVESGSLALGMTLRKHALEMGIVFRVVPKTGIDYGIELARGLSSKLWFDEKKCAYLIGLLESYRKKYNDKMQAYSDTPLHDYTSHAADAFRYMAVALQKSDGKRLSSDQILEMRERAGLI